MVVREPNAAPLPESTSPAPGVTLFQESCVCGRKFTVKIAARRDDPKTALLLIQKAKRIGWRLQVSISGRLSFSCGCNPLA